MKEFKSSSDYLNAMEKNCKKNLLFTFLAYELCLKENPGWASPDVTKVASTTLQAREGSNNFAKFVSGFCGLK